MWAKWRMFFHVARNRNKNQSFCHLRWPLWSERLSSIGSFLWVLCVCVFVCVFLYMVENCAFCSAYTIQCVVVKCTTHLWMISLTLRVLTSVPSCCSFAVAVNCFPSHSFGLWKRSYHLHSESFEETPFICREAPLFIYYSLIEENVEKGVALSHF